VSSDLAQSVVDAVTQALRDARYVDPDDDTMPRYHPVDRYPHTIDVWVSAETVARAAVAATLRAMRDDGWTLTRSSGEGRAVVLVVEQLADRVEHVDGR
jgi:hypothetical protein